MTRVLLAVLCAGCTGDLGRPLTVPDLDPDAFRCEVEPVLVARCAFLACHGSVLRPLRVYAPNRLRLGVASWGRERPLTAQETAANYDRARAMTGIDGGAPALLLKPLDVRAGGSFHRGQQLYGGDDVFSTTDDPGYRILERWIEDALHPGPDCVPTEEVGP